jgi:hypothetical protein
LLGLLGVVLVWTIAAVLLAKWLLDWLRKAQLEKAQNATIVMETRGTDEEEERQTLLGQPGDSHVAYDEPGNRHVAYNENPSPTLVSDAYSVVCVTLTGGIDEVAYYPSLLLTNTYTAWEVVIGTLLAAAGLLLIIIPLLETCRPYLELMDRLPLWVVVSAYAVVLTVSL